MEHLFNYIELSSFSSHMDFPDGNISVTQLRHYDSLSTDSIRYISISINYIKIISDNTVHAVWSYVEKWADEICFAS